MSLPTVMHVQTSLLAMRRSSKVALMLFIDIGVLMLCVSAALFLRTGDIRYAAAYDSITLLSIAIVTVLLFAAAGLYQAVVRFIDEHMMIASGLALVSASLVVHLHVLSHGIPHLPYSALLIYLLLAFSYVTGSRLAMRAFLSAPASRMPHAQHVAAIYGADDAGAQLAAFMRKGGKLRPVCFFDEKHHFNHQTIAGLRVYHTSEMADKINELNVDSIIVALPPMSPQRFMRIIQTIRATKVTIRILRGLVDLSDDGQPGKTLREIKVEDLLGRKPVPPQADLLEKCIACKNVIVTGAGGSIGSELCRQLLKIAPRSLHLLDHCEFSLYTVFQELQSAFPDVPIHAHLGSVCNQPLLERLFHEGDIDTVYHAAAYKHVPLVETNVAEGLRNNVIGAKAVANAAYAAGVGTCVLVSSDKAVRPTNIMGASKRIAELIFQAASQDALAGDGRDGSKGGAPVFCIVRFGNVLGSSGSVVPLFKQQMANGGPITVTHPDVVRYFMLIEEAAQLVIQAGAMATGGDLFLLDMGGPVRIADLARTMIAMCGLSERTPDNPDGNIEVKFVGMRPGEKLYEELLIDGRSCPTHHPRIMTTREPSLQAGILNERIAALMSACAVNERAQIEARVRALVEEYAPQTPYSIGVLPPSQMEHSEQDMQAKRA